MKIWFDLSNSPHVNMFYLLIKELESLGHEIIITSRPLANTIQLLDQKGLKHTVIGIHYGKNILKKIYGFPIRIFQLIKFLKSVNNVQLAVSQSSFHSPLVAFLLSIPSIYTNDNDHALGNKAAFLFASTILLPETFKDDMGIQKNRIKYKINFYPGIKEGIYLWRNGQEIFNKRSQHRDNLKFIYFRPEPQTAQYYNGAINFLDEMLCKIQYKYTIKVLPRDNFQMNHYKQNKFSNLIVQEKPIDFNDIATDCLLFIGAGGSMTRELSILGIPTISVYQDKLLQVDNILISNGLLIHDSSLNDVKLDYYLKTMNNNTPSKELIEKGKTAYQIFKKEILSHIK